MFVITTPPSFHLVDRGCVLVAGGIKAGGSGSGDGSFGDRHPFRLGFGAQIWAISYPQTNFAIIFSRRTHVPGQLGPDTEPPATESPTSPSARGMEVQNPSERPPPVVRGNARVIIHPTAVPQARGDWTCGVCASGRGSPPGRTSSPARRIDAGSTCPSTGTGSLLAATRWGSGPG